MKDIPAENLCEQDAYVQEKLLLLMLQCCSCFLLTLDLSYSRQQRCYLSGYLLFCPPLDGDNVMSTPLPSKGSHDSSVSLLSQLLILTARRERMFSGERSAEVILLISLCKAKHFTCFKGEKNIKRGSLGKINGGI